MARILRGALLAVVVTAAGATPAAAAGWSTVSGLVPGTVTAASLDGPRVLVASLTDRRRVELTTIAHDRVHRRQTLTTSGRAGTVRHLQVARLRGGRALAVWQEPGAVKASLRPSAGARFSPAVRVSRHPDAPTGAAIRPVLTVTPAGEAVVAWLGGPSEGRLGIQVATLPAGGAAWSSPADVSAGTFPQFPGAGVSAPLPLAAAADPAGGVVVAWGQPPAVTPAARALDVMAAVRTPAGSWAPPARLGTGGSGLALAAPAPGDVVAAWHDGACVDAATLRGVVVTAAEIACRAGALPARLFLTRTAAGGVVLASGFVPQPVPQTNTIEVAARDAAGVWTPSRLAIAGAGDPSGAVPATQGRTAVAATVGRGLQFNRVRVALIGPDGTVQRRIGGPTRPTPPPRSSVRVLPLGPGARVTMLLTPEPSLRSSRVSILTLG
jgi:hypothetical protein